MVFIDYCQTTYRVLSRFGNTFTGKLSAQNWLYANLSELVLSAFLLYLSRYFMRREAVIFQRLKLGMPFATFNTYATARLQAAYFPVFRPALPVLSELFAILRAEHKPLWLAQRRLVNRNTNLPLPPAGGFWR